MMNAKKPFQIKVDLAIQGDWRSQPLDFLVELTNCTTTLVENHQRTAVAIARDQGATWEEIGRALGVSRQAAWGRFATDD